MKSLSRDDFAEITVWEFDCPYCGVTGGHYENIDFESEIECPHCCKWIKITDALYAVER